MNQYDIDIVNFVHDFLLSKAIDINWLKHSNDGTFTPTWNNDVTWKLVNLQLSLNRDVDAYELALTAYKSAAAMDLSSLLSG